MKKITPSNPEELELEMKGGGIINLELTPHACYVLLVMLRAGRACLTLDADTTLAVEEMLTEIQDLFASRFPKAGEYIESLKQTMEGDE